MEVERVGQAKVSVHLRLGASGLTGSSLGTMLSLLFPESVPAQANIMQRFRPSVFSMAASPTSAMTGLSSLVRGAMTTFA